MTLNTERDVALLGDFIRDHFNEAERCGKRRPNPNAVRMAAAKAGYVTPSNNPYSHDRMVRILRAMGLAPMWYKNLDIDMEKVFQYEELFRSEGKLKPLNQG